MSFVKLDVGAADQFGTLVVRALWRICADKCGYGALLGILVMNTIGVAMVVPGMAFLFSGLIFLLPIERKISATNDHDRMEYFCQIQMIRRSSMIGE